MRNNMTHEDQQKKKDWYEKMEDPEFRNNWVASGVAERREKGFSQATIDKFIAEWEDEGIRKSRREAYLKRISVDGPKALQIADEMRYSASLRSPDELPTDEYIQFKKRVGAGTVGLRLICKRKAKLLVLFAPDELKIRYRGKSLKHDDPIYQELRPVFDALDPRLKCELQARWRKIEKEPKAEWERF
jgi:hypothetical protein